METHGPLGTLWVGLGLCAFYFALIWLNTLLGVFLTPLFIIPGTWLLDRLRGRRQGRASAGDGGGADGRRPVNARRTAP